MKKPATLLTLLTTVFLCLDAQRQSFAQESPAQVDAKKVMARISNLLAQTRKNILAQNTELSRLESKRRTQREQRDLLVLIEDRRDLVFDYYEAKIKALRELKKRQPSLTRELDELIAKTDRNWARDAKSLNERQARINKGYVSQPKQQTVKPVRQTPSRKPAPSINPNAEFEKHMQVKELKEKITGLEKQIADWQREKEASSAEYKRLTPAVNAAKTRRERDKAIAARNAAAKPGHKANARIGDAKREITRLKRQLAKLDGSSSARPAGKVFRDKNGRTYILK